MFDGKNLERETANNNVAVITKDGDDKFIELLRQQNILSPAESAVASDNKNNGILSEKFPEHATSRGLTSRIDLANSGDRETDNIFLEMGEIPKTVIVHVPDEDSFSSIKGDHYAYQYMFIDWFRLPFKDRPKVIMYTDRFKPPLYIKHSYQGFMFCSTPDELRNVMKLTDQMQKNLEEEIYNPSKLELGQKEAYNNSDLREWENKTADTYQSLKHLFNRINYRNNLHDDYYRNRYSSLFEKDQRGKLKWKVGADSEVTPMRQIRTILDLGGGEGREDIPLVLEGFKVLNLDLSSTQLDKTYNRVHEELEGLKGNLHNNELSYNALSQLQMEGVVGPISFSTEREVNDNYLRVEGSFFDLQYELNKALVEWNDRFPETDPYDFFNTTRYKEEAFSDPRDMFADVGFDMAMFNWHTFCETGSPENQKNVLEQILNVIWPGGELVLEIPDRKFEPYASALKAYHEEHPDEPYGTIRDKKPDDFDMDNPDRYYPPRYFPDINELVLLLKSVGFEIGEDDIQTYLIESTDLDGKRTMTLKEHFITARKSKT
jgi:SAM-dependent methyltransferase